MTPIEVEPGITWTCEETPDGSLTIYDPDGHVVYRTTRAGLLESLCGVLRELHRTRDQLDRLLQTAADAERERESQRIAEADAKEW